MITEAGLAVYQTFQGDIDGFARVGTAAQRILLPEREWGVVASLLQDLLLVEQGLVSAEYAAGVQHRLAHHCSSQEVIDSLKAIALAHRSGQLYPRVMAKMRRWLGK